MSEMESVYGNEPYGPDCISGSSALTFSDETSYFAFNLSSAEQSKALTVEEKNSHFFYSSNQSTLKPQKPSISE
jgi:hypothetical protein